MLVTKGFRIIQLLVAFLLFTLTSFSQNTRVVTGKVTDANGTGLPSVTITGQGTNTNTVTDADGSFHLALPRNEISL